MAIASARPESGQPMMEMNTTPLIDVMLVLLIMLIMTIPLATNSLDVDLPGTSRPTHEIRQANRLVVTGDDRILWNGSPVSRAELAGLLRQSTRMPVEPELQFEPQAGAGYDTAANILATIKRSGVTNFGFVGNDQFAEFGKAIGAK